MLTKHDFRHHWSIMLPLDTNRKQSWHVIVSMWLHTTFPRLTSSCYHIVSSPIDPQTQTLHWGDLLTHTFSDSQITTFGSKDSHYLFLLPNFCHCFINPLLSLHPYWKLLIQSELLLGPCELYSCTGNFSLDMDLLVVPTISSSIPKICGIRVSSSSFSFWNILRWGTSSPLSLWETTSII